MIFGKRRKVRESLSSLPTFFVAAPPTSKTNPLVADAQLSQARRISDTVVRMAVFSTLIIAGSNLTVWLFPSLHHIAAMPGMMVMRVNTCVALLFAALSLLTWHLAEGSVSRRGSHQAAGFLGAVAATIGGLTSIEYLFGLDLGLDTLLLGATFPGDQASAHVTAPGRMSFNAALSLFFLGLSLWGLDWTVSIGRARPVFTAPILAVISALPASFALVGYLAGTGNFTGLLKSTNILLHAALALLLLALGILAVRSDRQPVRRVLSRSAGGMLLRWMLPGSTISLILLTWFVGRGRDTGLIAHGEGRALMLFGGLILFYTLIVSVSRAVDDERPKRAVPSPLCVTRNSAASRS